MAKMQIPKLHNLAFREVHMKLWEHSKLPSLVVELAYRKQYVNSLVTKETEEEHIIKMQSALETIEESLMKLTYLPFYLKFHLLAAVAGLNEDITLIMIDIAGGFETCSKTDLKHCISKIILTESGGVDRTKTILNIIKESQLRIEFTPMFLAHHCIKTSDMQAIYKVVLKEINKKLTFKERKSKKNNKLVRIRRLKKFMSSLMDCVYYWEQTRTPSLYDYDDPRFRFASDLQYLAVEGHGDVLKLFYKKLIFSGETAQERRQEILMETAKFAFLNGAFNEEKVIFFYENLQLNNWTELLQKYFVSIFVSLLGSWRYRYLCNKFFKEMIKYQDVKKLKNLFNRIAGLCDKRKFEYYDIMSIIQSLWYEISQDFKEDIQIRQVMIPGLILPRADFETLVHFLKSYSIEMRKEILGQVAFGLLVTGRKELMQKCIETAKQLDLQIADSREMIDYDSFKHFLIINAQTNRASYSHLDSVIDLLCSSKSEEIELMKELFSDSAFLVELLVNMSAKEDVDNFLLWGLGNESCINTFKKKLLKEELIHEAYDRRLIENDDLDSADSVFVLLKYNSEEISMVRDRVAENTLVVRLMLIRLLETDHLKLTDQYLSWLFGTKEEKQQFMENFIFSEDGKNAIFDMLLTLENLCCYGAKMMTKCWYFKNIWLRPFGLVARMDEMLKNSRSEFMTHRIVVKDNNHFNNRNRQTATLYADAIFRGFTQIIQKEFTKVDLETIDYISIVNVQKEFTKVDLETSEYLSIVKVVQYLEGSTRSHVNNTFSIINHSA